MPYPPHRNMPFGTADLQAIMTALHTFILDRRCKRYKVTGIGHARASDKPPEESSADNLYMPNTLRFQLGHPVVDKASNLRSTLLIGSCCGEGQQHKTSVPMGIEERRAVLEVAMSLIQQADHIALNFKVSP
ncbi:unnamed protein product [Dibothriocephalus latus]|uniref:Uncharacterized protein n=1 Tax=Dibothriocephalus latus TaxID=60516 RepID=A0A3P6V3R8_DIBLA|nr:unnamed protein product [Dibothriocephalus latus]